MRALGHFYFDLPFFFFNETTAARTPFSLSPPLFTPAAKARIRASGASTVSSVATAVDTATGTTLIWYVRSKICFAIAFDSSHVLHVLRALECLSPWISSLLFSNLFFLLVLKILVDFVFVMGPVHSQQLPNPTESMDTPRLSNSHPLG
jgi:hypothetical protein